MAVRRGREVAAGAGAAIVLSGADVGPGSGKVDMRMIAGGLGGGLSWQKTARKA
jgi:hypothetical protein